MKMAIIIALQAIFPGSYPGDSTKKFILFNNVLIYVRKGTYKIFYKNKNFFVLGLISSIL